MNKMSTMVSEAIFFSYQALHSLYHQQVSRFDNCEDNVWFATMGLIYLLSNAKL